MSPPRFDNAGRAVASPWRIVLVDPTRSVGFRQALPREHARMVVAGHTYCFRDRPLGDALDELLALGLDAVEIWLGHVAQSPEAIHELLVTRRLHGVAVGIGGLYDESMESLGPALDLARAIGASIVVGCVRPDLLPRLADRMPPGIVFCAENHWDQPLATPEAMNRALPLGSNVAACLDTGHALLAGVPPDMFATALGPRLRHVHLKEARGPSALEDALGRRLRRRLLERPRPVFPGEGELDLPLLCSTLTQMGFNGVVTLEHEGDGAAMALAVLLHEWSALDAVEPALEAPPPSPRRSV